MNRNAILREAALAARNSNTDPAATSAIDRAAKAIEGLSDPERKPALLPFADDQAKIALRCPHCGSDNLRRFDVDAFDPIEGDDTTVHSISYGDEDERSARYSRGVIPSRLISPIERRREHWLVVSLLCGDCGEEPKLSLHSENCELVLAVEE